jgi:Dolichyl-phosphate-mannose-protein mannosyltransferase
LQPVVVWKLVILLPILMFLPGFAVILYVRDRYEANLILSEFIGLSLAFSVVIGSLVGFVLAEFSLYTLTRLSLLLIALSLLILLAWYLRRRKTQTPNRGKSVWWFSLGLLVIIIAGAVLFTGRFEAILTERDVSPYIVEGANIADRGKIFLENDTMSRLSRPEADLIYGSSARQGKGEYISGFRIQDQKAGEVSTRYLPFYSVLVAVSYRLLGLKGTLTFMNPYLAVLALLFMVLTARRLFDDKTALVAGLVLVVSPLMVWFARYPTPEIFTQFLVFLGIYCLCFFYPRGNGWWGLLAATAFGVTFTARLDLYAIVAPLAAFTAICLVIMYIKKERLSYVLWFVIPLVPLIANAWYTQRRFNGAYVTEIGSVMPRYLKLGLKILVPCIALLGILTLIALLSSAARRLLKRGWQLFKLYWRPALAIILLLLCLFAYFVRPHLTPGTFKRAGVIIPSNVEKNFYRMSWYLTHVGLVLFILGLVLFVLYGLDVRTMALFLIGGFFTLFIFYNPACNPLHFWFLRRFIPAVIPFMILMIAYAVVKLPQVLNFKVVKIAVGVSLVVLLVLCGLYTAKIYPVVQYEGALNALESLSGRFSDKKSVVILYGTYARTYFPEPLRYLYGVDALPLNGENGDPNAFRELVRKFNAEGKKVYLVGSGNSVPRASRGLFLKPVDSQTVAFKVLVQEYNRRPSTVVPFQFPLYIYELQTTGGTGSVSVDVGKADTAYIKEGFYDPEGTATDKYRWTGGTAKFALPNLKRSDRLTAGISASLGSRPTNKPIPVKVFVQDKELTTLYFDSSEFIMKKITFDKSILPNRDAKNLVFKIEVSTWTPSETMKSVDDRQLGIAINRLTIETAP